MVVLVVVVKTVADMEKKKGGKGSKKRRNSSSTSDMERRLCTKSFCGWTCDYSNDHWHYIQLELKYVFGIMKFQDMIFVRKLFDQSLKKIGCLTMLPAIQTNGLQYESDSGFNYSDSIGT